MINYRLTELLVDNVYEIVVYLLFFRGTGYENDNANFKTKTKVK